MASCKFYLKKSEIPEGKRLIKLRFTYNHKQVWFTFGESVREDDWDFETQRLKRNSHTEVNQRYLVNGLLDNLERVCSEIYNREIIGGYPDPKVIKTALKRYMQRELRLKHKP